MRKLVTRFAPSPSGPLHLGHAYAAIVAHEAARASGGRFLVRIEDLDASRSREAYEAAILDDLSWLGLSWDEAPIHQSLRNHAYAEALSRLDALGLVYPCFCTRREIATEIAGVGAAPHLDEQGELPPRYPGTCRSLNPAEREQRVAEGGPHVLRLDCSAAVAHAAAHGKWPAQFIEAWAAGTAPQVTLAQPKLWGDIVLARKDAAASYHLAVVVDDAFSQVNAVTRGEDLLAATHIQVLLQRLLDLPTPAYGHHPLVRDDAGKRLAKRDQSRALSHLRAAGWDGARVRAALPPLPDIARLIEAEEVTNR
ncbi:MAG: tRNA glutamyl-Q(34) synthetase GluQRS [Alphaproteobacteria bacterium]